MATKHKRATMTARQLAEEYLAHQITRDVTRTSTRHHLNQLLALFGGWQARRVGAAQIQEFLAAQKARGVMATTAHHRVRLWRTVLSWAVETGRLPASPLAGFRLHRPKARRIDPPTRAEAVRMYKVAAPHIRRVIVLGMAAGPRIGHAWHQARKAAGITRRITPYSLRHAMPTEALEHGADVKAVAEVMGHADPTMLLRVYQHTRYRLRKKAVNAAPGLKLDKI